MCAKSKTKNLIRLVRILQREINGPDILIYLSYENGYDKFKLPKDSLNETEWYFFEGWLR